jgi:hypothetical protein
MNFITKLPALVKSGTKIKYNSIFIVTDKLTKYRYFILYSEKATAQNLAYIFNRYIISQHGIPQQIISDKDKLFISKFWKSLIDQLDVRHKLSTAYYSEINGATERLNQIFK